ncbi:transcription antitermination protein NusB [Malacoplasma iowae]|uniref:Transcription antitermination protein NusB n=2 Tax=Malacoplasma iowae TaxID=2116 RepID=A0A084U2U0_MALIO|nr:transcription antitermination protein NusB [Malacoplasma iowae]VEU61955.1 N utilization substance protein B homolog [Mycoplasmopsis fermentans]EGZ31121.1 transcription termination factor N-utilization substance protein B [Malacoplasma iowae 695]KFB07276.1 transcription antitermination protein NusB [Malacoplasma iowae DK-CPA]QHG90041.1 transcription antitermination protein NusB [Malacoplasma iowae 695]WPL36228.1 transcription antitermination protein NusB [Malacoplasma iowae]
MKTNNLSQWEKRVAVFKFVYSVLISDLSKEETIKKFELELKNTINDEYINTITLYFIENRSFLEQTLEKHILKNWTIDRVDFIDKSIIYASISEFKSCNVNKGIIIDQAVITAKKYGIENSYKFVNYILDKVL